MNGDAQRAAAVALTASVRLARPGTEIAPDMNADHPATVVPQRLQVTRRLGALEDREGERLSGDRHVGPVVGRDLDVDAGVGTALVQLARAVQEAGSEPERGREMAPVADRDPKSLEGALVVIVRRDICHQCDVVAGARGVQMRGERARGTASTNVAVDPQRAVADRRVLIRQRAALLVLLQDGVGVVLRLLDVGFVERVDGEIRAGDRGRELPAEELRSQVVRVGEVEDDDRMARALERVDRAVELGITADAQGDEDAVARVDLGITDRLVTDRDDSLALLAGALGDQLLRPQGEALDASRREDGHLVTARVVQRSHHGAEGQPAVEVAGHSGCAVPAHVRGALQQPVAVDPDDRRGHEPEHAQRRVTPSDVRRVLEHVPEPALARGCRERRSRVGHRDEVRARISDPGGGGHLPEMREMRQRLQGGAGFARDDVPGPCGVDPSGDPRDRERVGGVEDVECRVPGGAPE